MPVQLKIRQTGPVTVAVVSGRASAGEAAARLDKMIQELIVQGSHALLLDMSGVNFMDSEGIKVLIRAYTSVHQTGGALKILKPSPHVRHVLEITHLLTVMEAFDDEEAALASFHL
jgi:anti-anti-sigma factor